MSPSPSRLIIELNSCFNPNPFNTGPAIPKLSQQGRSKNNSLASVLASDVESDAFARETPTPELTNSPDSSISSALSLSLEDEEIKRIFSNPKYDYPAGYTPQDSYAPTGGLDWSDTIYQSVSKEELNPQAVPFIPTFVTYSNLHNRINNGIDMNSAFQEPSPLALDFNPVDIALSPHSDQSPRPHNPPQPRSISLPPLFPPGLPHPPILYSTPQLEPSTPVAELTQCPPPNYLPVLLDALKPTTIAREREVLAHVIVNSTTGWNIESLLELAERLAEVASTPPDLVDGQELAACDLSRYTPVENGLRNFYHRADNEEEHEDIVAMVAEMLNNQFIQNLGDQGQFFAWNLREMVLMKFIKYWHCAKPNSITYNTKPSVQYVRSALTLCKSIAALFKRNLITREHISMCISILLKDLMSVEHAQALANLVLGCGPAFWQPLSSESKTEQADATVPDGSLLLASANVQANGQVNEHVAEFLAGLEANLMTRRLTGDQSVVGQPWGEGQLLATLKEIVDSVKLWRAVLTTTPTKETRNTA